MNLQNSRTWLAAEGPGILEGEFPDFTTETLPGEVYFVDGNKTSDSNDGSSWANAFQKLSTALAASHANIAITANRNWAGRNIIYMKADSITEDLVILADKTDVIGVGSQDYHSMPQIVGNHVPVSTNCQSCRFFNVKFKSPAAGGVIWTLISLQPGLQFNGCEFNAGHASGSVTCATIGVKATAVPRLMIKNSHFAGKFSTAGIHLLTGASNGTMIISNVIQSAGIGIDCDSGFASNDEKAFCIGNMIYATGLGIDDDSAGGMLYFDNRIISAGTIGGNSYDIDGPDACGNIISGSNTATTWPLAVNHG